MGVRRGGFVLGVAVLSAVAVAPLPARAQAGTAGDTTDATESGEKPKPKPEGDRLRTKPGYLQLFVTTFVGTGFRFNNPYRLSTPLGSDAESVSRTATYVDIGLGATFGNPLGLQHGISLRTSAAIEGVGQLVTTPSYFAWRRWKSLAAYGRFGIPLVLTPDVTWGLELGVGGAWFPVSGFGIAAEMVGDVFYGAGTADVGTASYPVLSGQLGLIIAYEVLP